MMRSAAEDQRGVISGLLSLSRNLGLMNGAALMGAVFAAVSASAGMIYEPAMAASMGMRAAFGIAVLLTLLAAAAIAAGRAYSARTSRRRKCARRSTSA